MTHKMRRSDRQLDEMSAEEIIQKGLYGILSTVGEDGWPHGVPLSYVYENRKLYFHCALEGHKIDNLRFNDKASFCVVGENEVLPKQFSVRYESVIARGCVREVGGEEKLTALSMLIAKYSPDFKAEGAAYIASAHQSTGVYRMDIETITGKARR